METTWLRDDVVRYFLDERRSHIPYALDQFQVATRVLEHLHPGPRRLMDLGCGDGIAARVILDRYPDATAVLVDCSAPMLERARSAMEPYGARVEFRLADLNAPLSPPAEPDTLDLVISAFAIHHLSHDRKQTLYREIHTALAPGGVFLNIEHVSSSDRKLEELFEQEYCRNLAERTGRAFAGVHREFLARPDRVDNILAPVETQLGWLRSVGFVHVDCYFKWLELAVFGGQRPAA